MMGLILADLEMTLECCIRMETHTGWIPMMQTSIFKTPLEGGVALRLQNDKRRRRIGLRQRREWLHFIPRKSGLYLAIAKLSLSTDDLSL
jgi:hypothetical protein